MLEVNNEADAPRLDNINTTSDEFDAGGFGTVCFSLSPPPAPSHPPHGTTRRAHNPLPHSALATALSRRTAATLPTPSCCSASVHTVMGVRELLYGNCRVLFISIHIHRSK